MRSLPFSTGGERCAGKSSSLEVLFSNPDTCEDSSGEDTRWDELGLWRSISDQESGDYELHNRPPAPFPP